MVRGQLTLEGREALFIQDIICGPQLVKAKVRYLDHKPAVHNTVSGLEVTMRPDLATMEVKPCPGGHRRSERDNYD